MRPCVHCTHASVTERARISRFAPERCERLRQHVSRRRLAVRASDGCHVHGARRRIEEAIRNRAQCFRQIRHAHGSDVRRNLRSRNAVGRLPQHRARAALQRLLEKIESVRAQTLKRDERAARLHVAAIDREVAHERIRRNIDCDAIQQCSQILCVRRIHPRAHVCASHHGSAFACTRVVAGSCSSPSGGTPIKRNAPAITLENTGAATSPP